MGRATYDWLVREGISWPYADQRAIVVTSRPLPDPIGEMTDLRRQPSGITVAPR